MDDWNSMLGDTARFLVNYGAAQELVRIRQILSDQAPAQSSGASSSSRLLPTFTPTRIKAGPKVRCSLRAARPLRAENRGILILAFCLAVLVAFVIIMALALLSTP
jgi:hypothetical protein